MAVAVRATVVVAVVAAAVAVARAAAGQGSVGSALHSPSDVSSWAWVALTSLLPPAGASLREETDARN